MTILLRRLRRVPRRYWFPALFIVLAFVSLPIQGLDWCTPASTARFKFFVAEIKKVSHWWTVIYPNKTQVTINQTFTETVRVIGNGTVVLTGKGGLSAGNPLHMTVTIYFVKNAFTSPEPTVIFQPGAFAAEVTNLWFVTIPQDQDKIDAREFPLDANITLTKQDDKWTGDMWVIYNQGGENIPHMTIDQNEFGISNPIAIGSEDVTVTARTNSLLISLTWVIIAFTALELKKE